MAETEAAPADQQKPSILGLIFDNPAPEGTSAPAEPSSESTTTPSAVAVAVPAVSENDEVKPVEPEDSVRKTADDAAPVPEPKAVANAEEGAGAEKAVTGGEEAKSPIEEKANGEAGQSPKEKKKRNPGYINPDRVKTGGVRDKPSADELTERMERIRLQNAKILAKREEADKDVQAYEETMVKDREAAKRRREVQNQINSQRQANAERKMGKMLGREWDAGKDVPSPPPANRGFVPRGGRVLRGGFRGVPRGGFRGRGGPPGAGGPASPSTAQPAAPAAPGPTPAEAAALPKS